MIKPFEFAADGRTFNCTVEERRGAKGEYWWWFSVSGDAQSYAPFQTTPSDTRASVQTRVLEFYQHRLWALSQPSQHGSHWGKRRAAVTPALPTPEQPS